MKRFGAGRSDALGLMESMWPAQAEAMIRKAFVTLESGAPSAAQLRELAAALDAYEKGSYYVAKVLAEATAEARPPAPTARAVKPGETASELKARFDQLRAARRALPPQLRSDPPDVDLGIRNRTATSAAEETVAFYALETAFSAVRLCATSAQPERLLGLNTAIDAFEAGMFEDAAALARDAANPDLLLAVSGAPAASEWTIERVAARMRALSAKLKR